MTPHAQSRHEKWHWFALLTITLLANVPMLSSTLFFSNDTLHAFVFFHFAYGELLVHNELPRWIPYLGYGTTFDFNLWNTIAATDYVTMAAGWLCGVTNALLLFKISLILCQCVLVMGLYLLSRRFFASMWTVWLVCLGGLLTTDLMCNAAWSLTSYFMVPLVLWFLLRFLDSKQPAQLWLAGLAEGVSLLGTVPYIAPLHLLIVLAFLVPFLCREPGLLRAFLNWRNFIHPLFFVFAGYFVLIGLWIASIDVVWLAQARDVETGNVPLDTFLGRNYYARRQPLGSMLRLMVKGDLYYDDYANYVGILPLALLTYALLRRRDTLFLSVAAVALVLLWFSLGGWFTTLTYYLVPTMKKYRFISMAWNFQRIFLLLLAGFGFDQILRDLRARKPMAVFSPRARTTVLLVLACCVLDHLGNGDTSYYANTDFVLKGKPSAAFQEQAASIHLLGLQVGSPGLLLIRYLLCAAALGLLWLLLTRRLKRAPPDGTAPGDTWARMVGPLLLAVYLADVGFYYSQVMKQAPWCPPDTPLEDSLDVHEMEYRPQRNQLRDLPPDADRIRKIIECNRGGSTEFAVQNTLASAFVLMQYDPAVYVVVDDADPATVISFRLDLMMPDVKKMFDARQHGNETFERTLLRDVALRRSIGARLDKARMIRERDIIFAGSEQQARAEFKKLADPDRRIVVEGTSFADEGAADGRADADLGKVELEFFSANRVVFKVPRAASGWLFYADAYSPAWKALVDGKAAKVYRANIGFKAVRVPQGAREVTFFFDGGWHDLHYLAFVVASGLLAFALTGLLVAVPWMTTIEEPASPPSAADSPNVNLETLWIWSGLAWLAMLAAGLALADAMCLSLLVVALAGLVVFIVHNR